MVDTAPFLVPARPARRVSRRGLLRLLGAGVAGAGAAVVLAPSPAAADTIVAGSGSPAASDNDVVHKGGSGSRAGPCRSGPGILAEGGIATGTSFTINSTTAAGALNTDDNSIIEWIVVQRG